MGKVKQHVEGRTKAQRIQVRKNLGTLKQLTVQPQTRLRYTRARQKFYKFLSENSLTIPTKREALDNLLAEYIEFLWESGEGRGLASDTVAGLQDLDPKLKGHLALTWRLLKTWSISEVPNRAPPLPETALRAMVGWSIFHEHHDFALSLLLGFYGLLRTGEILSLSASAVFMSRASKPAVISLGLTKGGKRVGASESVTIQVGDALQLLWKWKKSVPDPDLLAPSSSQWRALFAKCLEQLHLSNFGFRPYSLRRGGATCWFHRHGNFDKLLVLGRWQAAKTARIYINDGLAMLAELKLPQKHLQPFQQVYSRSFSAAPKLEQTRRVELGDVDRGVSFFRFCKNCSRLGGFSVRREPKGQ